ncbi:MAG: flagellar hook-basal body complex protein FliE [Eubacteriales bacterium]|nr:flagellar hook-basal body complex protein FliE [Eubacteriales bacterium]
MDLSALSGVDLMTAFQTPTISSSLAEKSDTMVIDTENSQSAFSAIFQSAVNMIQETNAYSNAAEEEEIKYALGESDSIHDLQIAQQKANVSLQYTVAVRDAFIEGYNNIMNLQF